MSKVLGTILQELLQKEGSPSVKDFAKMIGLSSRTVYNIFDGSSSMTFDQVVRASEILKVDISEEYFSRSPKGEFRSAVSNPGNDFQIAKNNVTVTITLSGNLSSYENFPELLNKLRSEARELGFNMI